MSAKVGGILFTVEKKNLGRWDVVAHVIEARGPRQAVTRACGEEGTYRARAWGSKGEAIFWVSAWGQPERILRATQPKRARPSAESVALRDRRTLSHDTSVVPAVGGDEPPSAR